MCQAGCVETPHGASDQDADLEVVDPRAPVFIGQRAPWLFQNKPGTFLLPALERALGKKKVWPVGGAHDAQPRFYDYARGPAEEVPPVRPMYWVQRRIEAADYFVQTCTTAGVLGKLQVVKELHYIRLVRSEIRALHATLWRVWHHDVF